MAPIPTTLDILKDLIRFDTQNPPGDERDMVGYIAAHCERLGIAHTVHTYAERRSNIIITIGERTALRSLTVLGHVDVVRAEAKGWTCPPFAAQVHDGFLYGRGTLDMKYFIAAAMTVMRRLKAIEPQLRRQIVFLFTADEETGSNFGIKRLLGEESVVEAVAGSIVLNEGGGFALTDGEVTRYLFETGQKSVARLRVTIGELADTNPYFPTLVHESILVEVLQRLQGLDLDAHLPGTIARLQTLFLSEGNTLSEADRKLLQTMSCSMVTPTVIHGGSRNKQLPAKVKGTVDFDCRLLPHITKERFVSLVEDALAGLPVTYELTSFSQGYEAHVDERTLRLLERTLQDHDPQIRSLEPFITPGSNDGKYLRPLGCEILGFAPLDKGQPFSAIMPLIHGVDERISLKSLHFCEQVLHDVCVAYLTGDTDRG